LADGLVQGIEGVGSVVSETFFEPVIRLGVTGLSRAGKTVFITSLVANLLERGRMVGMSGVSTGAIRAAFLQPQPDDTVPRFSYETHLSAMTGTTPHWPESTRSVSELRLSFRIQQSGLLGGLSGPRTVHIDIVDYPGEWLLDLALLEKSYAEWSANALNRMSDRSFAKAYLQQLGDLDATAPFDEAQAQSLASSFTGYLTQARDNGLSDCTPGRFLLPGDLAGSPALTFAPLAMTEKPPRRSLWREMERRYEAYKSRVVKPFFRDHFQKLDRQIVLIDVLGAIHAGPRAVEDLRQSLQDILGAFRPGKNAFLSSLFGSHDGLIASSLRPPRQIIFTVCSTLS
jgi:predicted YcjX-like family ATPase